MSNTDDPHPVYIVHHIGDLLDVDGSTPRSQGDTLLWEESEGQFKPGAPSATSGGGATSFAYCRLGFVAGPPGAYYADGLSGLQQSEGFGITEVGGKLSLADAGVYTGFAFFQAYVDGPCEWAASSSLQRWDSGVGFPHDVRSRSSADAGIQAVLPLAFDIPVADPQPDILAFGITIYSAAAAVTDWTTFVSLVKSPLPDGWPTAL